MSKRKINFICPGAQKSGTTTLFSMLVQHPDVYLPAKKELYFFDDDRNFKMGYDWYESLFAGAAGSQILGDITPDYMLFPKCAERIRSYNPDVKLLIILRNPADRAFSHYQMKKRDTEENSAFDEALKAEEERTSGNYRKMMKYSYLQRGFYYRQLKPYFELFPHGNINVVIFEEFVKDIMGNMADIEIFLGIARFDGYIIPKRTNEGYLPKRRWIAYIKRHMVRPFRGVYNKIVPADARRKIHDATDAGILPKEIMDPGMRRQLMKLYGNDIKSLEKLLNRDLLIWA